MNKQQAIKLAESKFWESMSHREIAVFQICEPLLCVPFSVFHEAVEKTLGRPVFAHEFVYNLQGIKSELLDGKNEPSFQEILNLIPSDKLIMIGFPPNPPDHRAGEKGPSHEK